MPGLSDFNPDTQQTQPTNSLADFKPDVATIPVNNVPSTSNLAAHSAMFSGDPQTAINSYQQIQSESAANGGSQTAQNIIGKIQADNVQKAQNVLPTILQDDTLSDKQKSDAINNVFDQSSPMYKPSNILTSEAIVSPVKGESNEQENLRVNLGSMIDDMNSRKATQQKMVNASLAQQSAPVSSSLNAFMSALVPGWGLSQMFPKTAGAIQSMVPGVTEKTGAEVGYKLSQAQGGGLLQNIGAGIKGAFTTGAQQQAAIRDAINNADPKDQMAITQHLVDAINSSTSGNLFLAPQDFAKADYLQQTLGDGFISNKDKWASTVFNVVDLFGGALSAVEGVKAAGVAAKAGKATEGVVGASRAMPPELTPSQGALFDPPNLAVSNVQPTSVAMNIKDVNADKFRSIHDAAAMDTTDDVAKAFYGTDREQAVRNDLFPDVARPSGAVTAKVSNPDIQPILANQVDPSLKNFVDNDGAIWATDKEKLQQASLVTNDFDSAFQVNNKKEMAQIESLENDVNGNTVRIKAVYGPGESGFSDPGQALDAVQFGLRDYGVAPENMTLLRRVGGDYVPVGPTTTVTRADPGFIKAAQDSDIEAALNKGNYARTTAKDGQELRLVGADHGGDVREVVAFDKDGNKVGNVLYGQGGDRIDNPNVKVSPDWQKKGVANAMYDYAEKHGATFPKPDTQTFSRSAAGQSFRDARANPGRVKASFTGPQDTYATTSLNEVNDFKQSMLSENPNVNTNPAEWKDFLVQVNHDYKFNPFNMDYSDKTVNNNGLMNWFSRLNGSSGKGSLQRHLVTPTSMFDPAMTLGRSKGINKAAGIEHQLVILGQDVANGFNKLPKERQGVLWDMMKEQNAGSFKFDRTRMIGAGLSENEMNVMDNWSKFWDNSWFFENRDNTKSLINRGYMRYADEANDVELHARPVKQGSIPNGVDIYDPVKDEIRHVSKAELGEHYKNGGTAAELANPIIIGGDAAEHILSRETIGEGYLRALTQDDRTLNYRPGYYHVEYKDPHIIIQKRVLDSGKELHIPVATAANTRDAELMGKRLSAQDGLEYYHRPNDRTQLGRDITANQLNVSRGRSPQRVRGTRLANATADISDPSHSNIKSPAEALIDSSRSLSKRLGTRDSQDAIAKGMLQQYGEFFPKGKTGQPMIPGNVSEIKYSGEGAFDPKKLAAARSTFEYYNQFNNAYINSIDETYKGLLNSSARLVADLSSKSKTLGKVGGKVEASLLNQAATAGPAGKLRNIANTFYIVTNPVKQLLVQGAQVMQMAAINPAFWGGNPTKALSQTMYLISRQFGMETESWMAKAMGMSEKEAVEMWEHFQLSGNVAAIDKHTMIVGGLKDFADSLKPNNGLNKFVGRPIGAGLNYVRKVGFDAGENLSQVGAWLTYRDKALRSGETMADAATRDKVAALATNATGNMNGSAIQPFEQNDLNLIFQFMGWQQRWASNLMGNRVINTFDKGMVSTKAALRTQQLLMYGIPGGYAGAYALHKAGILPDDPKIREAVVNGLSGLWLNKLSSVISHATGGGDIDADWSALSPFDLYGVADHFHQLMVGDAGQIVATAPAATLFYGNNGKLTKAARTAAQYTHLINDDTEQPATFLQVAKDFASAFPLFSNTFKAAYSFEVGKKLSAVTGKVTDENVQPLQAIMYAFGINENADKRAQFVNQLLQNDYKELKSDIQYWHDRQREILLRNDITPDELAYGLRMQSECWRVFNNYGQTARTECNRLIAKDVQDGDVRVLKQVMKSVDMESKSSAMSIADMYPNTDKDKADKYRELVKYLGTDKKEEVQ